MNAILQIGYYALSLLQEQIEQGIDENGKQYKYSTRPFAMPLSRKLKNAKALEKSGDISFFKTKQGKAWVIVKGGYAAYREMSGRNPSGDFLQFTGRMLQSLSVREENGIAIIYFTDKNQAQKAFWLTKSGAGKSRHTFKFMGLTAQNKAKLAAFAARLIGTEEVARYLRL